jgi:hypothetical protein
MSVFMKLTAQGDPKRLQQTMQANEEMWRICP